MNHIYDSCILIGESLDKNNKKIIFDIFNGGRFLSLQPGKDMSEYDSQFIANKLAQSVTNETNLYKNNIQPFVREIIEEINKYINQNTLQFNKASEYNINIVEYPELAKDILNHKFFNFDPAVEYNNLVLPDKNMEKIYKSEIEIKDSSFNRMAKDLFTQLDLTEDKINNYYTYIYSDPTLVSHIEINNIIKAFLYFAMINDEYPDYFSYLKRIGCAISFLKNKLDLEIDNGALIASVKDKDIYLYGKVYETIPNKGDLTEAIYGASLENDINSSLLKCSLQNIISNKDTYEKRWEQYNITANYEDPLTKQRNIKSIILLTVENHLKKMDEDLFKYIDVTKEDLGKILVNTDNYLNSITIEPEFNSLSKVIYKIMSDIIFTKTNYGQFTEIANELLSKSNKLEMPDIVTLVNAKFIVRYLIGKTKIIEF